MDNSLELHKSELDITSESKKKRKISSIVFECIRVLVMMISLCIFSYSCYELTHIYVEYRVGQEAYDDIDRMFSVPDIEDEEDTNQDEEKSKEKKPQANWKWDYEKMLAKNADTKGYIRQENTVISYPIVQGADNDYYLNHTANHIYSKVGAIFVDHNIKEDLDARHSIVYGHNMNDGSMFASLMKYKSEDYFKKHPTMDIYIKDRHYIYYVFGAYETSAYDELTYSFDEMDYRHLQYIQMVRDRTVYDTNLGEIGLDDKILTLSTCTNYNDQRFVVHLIRGPEIKD